MGWESPPPIGDDKNERVFGSIEELTQAFPGLRRSRKLHTIVERRLACLLQAMYPEAHAMTEPGEMPGGRADLAFYFPDGRYVLFEVFVTVSQVPQDLRHLEQSSAQVRIAVLTDPQLDGGRIHDEYFRKRPSRPFPWIALSDLLLAERESTTKETLKRLIDEGFALVAQPAAQTRVPELILRLFAMDRRRAYTDELVLSQTSRSLPWSRVFGLALDNSSESTLARGISIRLSLYWGGGAQLQRSPVLQPPRRLPGWSTQVPKLVSDHPAVLTFSDPDLMCFHGHPLEWVGFKLTLDEQWNGYLELHYKISSIEPRTDKSGKLRITISG